MLEAIVTFMLVLAGSVLVQILMAVLLVVLFKPVCIGALWLLRNHQDEHLHDRVKAIKRTAARFTHPLDARVYTMFKLVKLVWNVRVTEAYFSGEVCHA
jgi:hypothetical protein